MTSIAQPTFATSSHAGVISAQSDSIADFLVSLLRAPKSIAEKCRATLEEQREVATRSLACVVVGCTVFGTVIGLFRGGLQTVYAGLKMPLAMLVALAITVPAVFAMGRALKQAWSYPSVGALVLAAFARSSLVMLALAPALWLVTDVFASYHLAADAFVSVFAVSLLFGIGVLTHGVQGGFIERSYIAVFASVVFIASIGQASWVLRPFLMRPRTEDVVFLRPVDGTQPYSNAARALASSLGIYRHETRTSRRDSLRSVTHR